MTRQPSDGPEFYEIRLRGHLDASRAQIFEGLQLVQEPGGDTVLTGAVMDQAALHGVLSKIRDLGVALLSVRRLSQDERHTEGRVST